MGDSAAAPITLRYRVRRGDVWAWYWTSWREGLWRTWVGAGLILAALLLALRGQLHPIGPGDLVFAALCLAALALFFAAYPQIAFKAQERVLTAGPGGIDTVIGGRSGHRDWSEIAGITDTGAQIAIKVARSGNAVLIPDRAFADSASRALFLRHVTAWRAQGDVGAHELSDGG